jgi:formylglycine-generating enzyme required for sulfatase activity
MMPWRTFLARTAIASVMGGAALALAVFVGVRLASADPGGPTRDGLTYAGVLRSPPATPTALVFEFNHRTRGAVCTITTAPVTFDATGAFSVEVSLASCPNRGRDFFDGDAVTYSVRLGSTSGETVATGVNVTPVPYARFADQAGVNNTCPVGYALDAAASSGRFTVCVRPVTLGAVTVRDEVVRVGSGASAFWVDRFEASAWSAEGLQRGASDGNYPGLSDGGQWAMGARESVGAYAVTAVVPSRNVSWFQASALCRASGKRLLTRDEWFAAADGLTAIDPTTPVDGNASGETRCNTGGSDARRTGNGGRCASAWGAQDMVGNVMEWTAEWYASAGQITSPVTTMVGARVNGIRVNDALAAWPSSYGDDATWNVTATVYNEAEGVTGVPAAALRGGTWGDGARAGVYALYLHNGPSNRSMYAGFRCVVSR